MQDASTPKGFNKSTANFFLGFVVFALCINLVEFIYKEKWAAFYYPNKNNLTYDQFLGEFPSLEECRKAINAQMASTRNYDADYECGLNCDMSTGKPYICKKTER